MVEPVYPFLILVLDCKLPYELDALPFKAAISVGCVAAEAELKF